MSRRKQAKPRSVKGKKRPAAGPSCQQEPMLSEPVHGISLFHSFPPCVSEILNVLFHQGQAGAVIFTTRVISYVNIKSVCSFKVKEDEGLIVIGATILSLILCRREDLRDFKSILNRFKVSRPTKQSHLQSCRAVNVSLRRTVD